jgi:hypothetical protein
LQERTGNFDDVEFRDDNVQAPVLVGRGYPINLEDDAMPDDEYFVGPVTSEDWQMADATPDERRRLRHAGSRVD